MSYTVHLWSFLSFLFCFVWDRISLNISSLPRTYKAAKAYLPLTVDGSSCFRLLNVRMTRRGHHTQFICKSFIISNNICPLETFKFHIKNESRLATDKPTLLVSANSWEACSSLRAVLTKFYKPTAQKASSPNSKCQTGSEDSRKAVLVLLSVSGTVVNHWCSVTCVDITPNSASPRDTILLWVGENTAIFDQKPTVQYDLITAHWAANDPAFLNQFTLTDSTNEMSYVV